MIQLTEENNKLKREKTMLTQNEGAKYREQLERKAEEIRTLKDKLYEQSSEQGLQLLSVLRDGNAQPTSSLSDQSSAPKSTSAESAVTVGKL